MFKGSSNSGSANTVESNSPDRLNRIVEGTTIEGDIKSDSNLRIDGKVKGTVDIKGRLVIGPNGQVEGEVICNNADIEGSFSGTLAVKELLHLKSTAKVSGNISTGKLAIDPPAVINGNIDMGGVVKDLNHGKQNKSQKSNSQEAITA